MKIIESYGPKKDQDAWSCLQTNCGDKLAHELWCAVIQHIAESCIRILGEKPESAEGMDEMVDFLFSDWQFMSMPVGSELAMVLGDLDYFREMSLDWYDRMSFSGEACPFVNDVVNDLKDQMTYEPDACSAVNHESVHAFYTQWRTQFLRLVLNKAELLKASNQPPKCQADVDNEEE